MILELHTAIRDFREARQKAILREIMARLTGSASPSLLSFEQVRSTLKAQVSPKTTLKEIPLDAIVGSVNRYDDFTRDFLPRESVDEERWARIEIAAHDMKGLPPIEAYQIGQVYFVSDGNHRVSVAKRLGATHIQAYVTEVYSRVPLTPDIRPEELILKAEYADFLEHTNLDKVRPQADLSLSVPGQYQVLEEHIAVHRYYMGQKKHREIPIEEAAAHWYDTVYWPIVKIIRERGLLRDFPGRTEADLYLWLSEHQAKLQEELSGRVEPGRLASDFVAQHSPRLERRAARLGQKVLEAVIPEPLEGGPEPGQWRQEKTLSQQDDRLFRDILVPVNGREDGWHALDQAILVAQRENADLHGLHVVRAETRKEAPEVQRVKEYFDRRCLEANVPGVLVVNSSGSVVRKICENARWNDLIVVNLTYPPAPQTLARLSSGFRNLIQQSPRPILAVPQVVTPLQKALLAYDGSPKAREAMFVAAYLAGRWKISLSIVTVFDQHIPVETLMEAMVYMEERDIQPTPIKEEGPVAETILRVAEEHGCDLILMGGYGNKPVLDAVLGSSVDQVLRESRRPILLCR